MEKIQYQNNRLSCEAGFTLIEVIIGMAVLTIGILATVAIQYQVVQGNSNGNVVTQEMYLAQRIMEQMKNGEQPSTLTGSIQNSLGPDGTPTGPYNINVTVTNPIGGNGSRLITVAVAKSGGFIGHPITLRALTLGSGI